jgi:hypothetical protein
MIDKIASLICTILLFSVLLLIIAGVSKVTGLSEYVVATYFFGGIIFSKIYKTWEKL